MGLIFQVTANVSGSAGDRDVIPALGIAWSNWVTVRLLMKRTINKLPYALKEGQKAEMCVRNIETIFSPHRPNIKCTFVIDEEGVKGFG